MSLFLLTILVSTYLRLSVACVAIPSNNVRCVEAAVNPTEGDGIYCDDKPDIATESVLGWELTVPDPYFNGQITVESGVDPARYFIGPFFGISTPARTVEVEQTFACSKESNVSVEFNWYRCGRFQNQDVWRLFLEDVEQTDAGAVDTDSFNSGVLSAEEGAVLTERSQGGGAQHGCTRPAQGSDPADSWDFLTKSFDTNGISNVAKDEPFTVRFEMQLYGNNNNEFVALGDIKVRCTALDEDGDGVANSDDNCLGLANPRVDGAQPDMDEDGVGDACDDDRDGDGVANSVDNCPDDSNKDQADMDDDDIGDACDDDKDGDGVPELDENDKPLDNCPDVANKDQADMDGDGIGDACDPDKDGDGVNEFDASDKPLDNCPDKYNPYQKDRDHDGKGDKCDYDIDNDGVANKFDDCPYTKGPIYNKGCPDYGRGGRDDGRGRNDYGGNRGRGGDDGYGRVDPRDDTGRGRGRRDGSYSYSGSYSSSSGRGRGRRGSFSGSYSSSSGNSRNGRSGRGYVGSDDYKGGRGGSYKGDERQQLEEMLRQLEEQYRGSSKY